MRVNEIITEDLEEGWKQKLAGAALAGGMAMGAGGAQAADWKDAAMTGAMFIPGIGQVVKAYNVVSNLNQARQAGQEYNRLQSEIDTLAKNQTPNNPTVVDMTNATPEQKQAYLAQNGLTTMDSVNEQVLDEYSSMDPGIRTALEKKGYKWIGQGVDQAAFIEPRTGHVLKIFGTKGRQGFSRDHKMFFEWAAFCEQHQSNKFLPRFYGHESFMWQPSYAKTPHRYLMIRTEFLKDSEGIGSRIAKLAQCLNQYPTIEKGIALFESYSYFSTELQKYMGNVGEFYALAETIFKLNKMGKSKRWGWDLHHGNIMLRKDGTPVLNDPWVIN